MMTADPLRLAVKVQEAVDAAKFLHGDRWPGLRDNFRDQLIVASRLRHKTPQEVAIDAAKNAGGNDALMIIAAAFDPEGKSFTK